MAAATPILPARRHGLIVQPLGDNGQYVVKDRLTGAFFTLGEREYFLLNRLDGTQRTEAVCAAYREAFGVPLSEADLGGFVAMARDAGLLEGAAGRPTGTAGRQNVLYWRRHLWDPDRFFTWLAPKIGFFWTRGFFIISAVSIVAAGLLCCANRDDLARSFTGALRWQTGAVGWLAVCVVTLLHECAHGLTCKRYGGEVHEIGFMLMIFLPGFYCNVSDAWLFREKSKRLWVTLAGGYFELFLWACAVFAWRLTAQDTFVNYMAFVVLSVCGVQVLFNFNPLLKFDGYYLLSDWLEIPNLYTRSHDFVKGWVRRLLWGAVRPTSEPCGRVLLGYGTASWLFSFAFIGAVLAAVYQFLGTKLGWIGPGVVACAGVIGTRHLFTGISTGEVTNMFRRRHKRTVIWLLMLGGVWAALALIEIDDWAGGTFHVRPTMRAEVRAPVAGFIQAVYADEGERVSAGTLVGRLDIPDLASRLEQKNAEVNESQARLRLLEAGPRREVVVEQRRRVERAQRWCDLGKAELDQYRQALQEELSKMDKRIAQFRAELEFAGKARARVERLPPAARSHEAVEEVAKKFAVWEAELEQAIADRRLREAQGVLTAEAELAKREKDLADAQAALNIMEAGTRPEEIDVERAKLCRLQEELRYLQKTQAKLALHSPVAGLITTARLKEKLGQYVKEGDLICTIEEPATLEVEITLPEPRVARVQPGQPANLRARALPLATLPVRVNRIAPAAGRGDIHSLVTVYCRFDTPPDGLRPGMSGYARVYTGPRPIGAIAGERALAFLRTEFWFWW